MSQKKQNERNVNKRKGYCAEDAECRWCLYYKGKKRGCALSSCCCEEEKSNAVKYNRVKRERGSTQWNEQ